MRTVFYTLILALSLHTVASYAEVFRWVDANGNVIFGDNPPKKSQAKTVELPPLTVADSFTPNKAKSSDQEQSSTKDDAERVAYTEFKISSPNAGDTLRSNNGALTVSISLKPALQAGDEITLYIDSKQAASGAALSFSVSELDRGEHSVFAVLNDAKGNIIKNTDPVSFHLLRAAVRQGG